MKKLNDHLAFASSWIIQPLLVLAILVLGFFGASRLSLRSEPPRRAEGAVYAPLVRTVTATRGSVAVRVTGNGTLAARTRISLVPQVGGEVLAIDPGLRTGGRFAAEAPLLRIEPRDFELAVRRAEADLSAARTAVVTTHAESEAAVAEWERLNPGEPCPPLVRLEPQLLAAEASVLGAETALAQAALALERTALSLPFAGRVVNASVDVGQVVAAGQSLGVVYATDVFEVAVPLRASELRGLELPDGSDEVRGAQATVRGVGAGGALEATGRVARVHGELDGQSRFARVVVELRTEDLDPAVAERLLPGTFLDVELTGRTLDGVAELPRGALRDTDLFWVVTDGRLRFVTATVVHRGDGAVYVEGLPADARVVVSNLEVVTDGMQVRVEGGSQ